MDWTVVGLFDDVKNAQAAVEALLDKGVSSHDISVVRPAELSGRRTALTDLGIADSDVASVSEHIAKGGTLVSVRTSRSEYAGLMVVLKDYSAVDIGSLAAPVQSTGSTSVRTNQDPYLSVYARQFEDFESDFREDCDARYGSEGGGYERYRPAYQYGWTAYNLFGFSTRDWERIEPELQADWEHSHPDDAWADYRDAVRTGWESCKRGEPAGGRGGGEDASRGAGR